MIISILEHYENENDINWLCDISKVTEEFRKVVVEAIDDGSSSGQLRNGHGFQNDNDRFGMVEPPCMVEAEIELWQ